MVESIPMIKSDVGKPNGVEKLQQCFCVNFSTVSLVCR